MLHSLLNAPLSCDVTLHTNQLLEVAAQLVPTSPVHLVEDRSSGGMTQLFRELDYSEEHSTVLISPGLHSKLMQALRSHSENEGIQCSGLQALARLGMKQAVLLSRACALYVL